MKLDEAVWTFIAVVVFSTVLLLWNKGCDYQHEENMKTIEMSAVKK